MHLAALLGGLQEPFLCVAGVRWRRFRPLFLIFIMASRFCRSLRPALGQFSRFVFVGGSAASSTLGVVPAIVAALPAGAAVSLPATRVGISAVAAACLRVRGLSVLWFLGILRQSCIRLICGSSFCAVVLPGGACPASVSPMGCILALPSAFQPWSVLAVRVLHGLPSLVVMPVGVLPPVWLSASAVQLYAGVWFCADSPPQRGFGPCYLSYLAQQETILLITDHFLISLTINPAFFLVTNFDEFVSR